jgi:hypothetical protein
MVTFFGEKSTYVFKNYFIFNLFYSKEPSRNGSPLSILPCSKYIRCKLHRLRKIHPSASKALTTNVIIVRATALRLRLQSLSSVVSNTAIAFFWWRWYWPFLRYFRSLQPLVVTQRVSQHDKFGRKFEMPANLYTKHGPLQRWEWETRVTTGWLNFFSNETFAGTFQVNSIRMSRYNKSSIFG